MPLEEQQQPPEQLETLGGQGPKQAGQPGQLERMVLVPTVEAAAGELATARGVLEEVLVPMAVPAAAVQTMPNQEATHCLDLGLLRVELAIRITLALPVKGLLEHLVTAMATPGKLEQFIIIRTDLC